MVLGGKLPNGIRQGKVAMGWVASLALLTKVSHHFSVLLIVDMSG